MEKPTFNDWFNDTNSTSYNKTNMDSMNGEGNFLFSVNDVKNNEQSFSNEISISNKNPIELK